MNIFDHKVLYVGCERMPGFTSACISLDLKKFSINILKCIVLKYWWKLNTCRIVKTRPFRFLRDYYGDSLDVMFPQFPNHFLLFPMVFSHVSPRVFLLFPLSVSPVSYFRFCDFFFFFAEQLFSEHIPWARLQNSKYVHIDVYCFLI